MAGQGAATATADAEGHELRPDPLQARTPAEFMMALRQYRIWMGEPPYRTMAGRLQAADEHTGTSRSASALCDRLNADTMPRLDLVVALVAACGGNHEDQSSFATAWRTIRLSQLATRTQPDHEHSA